MTDTPFVSSYRSFFDDLVKGAITPAGAVERALAFEDAHGLRTPSVYVSTAITSGGYKRDAALPTPEVIRLNNAAAQSLLTALQSGSAPGIDPRELMVPTELGKVPGWTDSSYLVFYFSWLSGLGPEATAWIEGRLADAVIGPTLAIADDRAKPNRERWPFYEQFTDVLLTHLAVAKARRPGKVREASASMLQLVDTRESLGCRAEDLYAQVAGMDLLTVTLAPDLPEPLAAHVRRLTELHAPLGMARKPVQLVPVVLR